MDLRPKRHTLPEPFPQTDTGTEVHYLYEAVASLTDVKLPLIQRAFDFMRFLKRRPKRALTRLFIFEPMRLWGKVKQKVISVESIQSSYIKKYFAENTIEKTLFVVNAYPSENNSYPYAFVHSRILDYIKRLSIIFFTQKVGHLISEVDENKTDDFSIGLTYLAIRT